MMRLGLVVEKHLVARLVLLMHRHVRIIIPCSTRWSFERASKSSPGL